MMDDPNQAASNNSAPHPSQGYRQQLQPPIWSGNKTCSINPSQNSRNNPYSQQMSHYYQAPYSTSNEMNKFSSVAAKDQNSHSAVYSSPYPVARQNNFSCANPPPSYPVTMKNSSSNMFYGNVNVTKSYPVSSAIQTKNYVNSSFELNQAPQAVPQSIQVSQNTGMAVSQFPNYEEQNNYMQNMYVNNYNVQSNEENQSFLMRQAFSPQQRTSMGQATQVSSIPTPPETSSLIGDGTCLDTSVDSVRMNISTAAFALPGSSISHIPISMSSNIPSIAVNSVLSHRNAGSSLQPPANLDEGSQASSASASSSLPDEQNSAKTNSKPNFSYPPTPNTLSSPGAASISSFHDDLECISSPGWPRTPASPVANSSYEFANIKRPENLLKLYTLSDEPDRRYFLDKLIVFNEERGSPITQCPTISKQPLDVFKVYLTVKERGGFVEVTNAKRWKDIAGVIGVGASSSAAYTLRKQYMKLLLPFECKFDRGGIDPQPIINMVEASSRKKGKSTTSTYGNPSPCNQVYSQVIDRYHPNFSSCQSSQYPRNSIEHQYSTNSVHYEQSVTHSTHSNAVSGQRQYNQYSYNSLPNCGYYQANNSSRSSFCTNNLQNSSSVNTCRYGTNTNLSAVPHHQEQGYYTQQYSSQHGQLMHENNYISNHGYSGPDNFLPPITNQAFNNVGHSKINSETTITSPESNATLRKAASDTLQSMSVSYAPLSSPNFESSQDNKSYSNNYSISNKSTPFDQNSIISPTAVPTSNKSQAYQNATSDNIMNKIPDLSYHSSPQASHSIVNSHSNPKQNSYMSQNSYSNPKFHYQVDYQAKEQVQANQFSQYSETQNETYRCSEGPPLIQTDRRNSPSGDVSSNIEKMYNSATQKATGYDYDVQQGSNANAYNTNSYPTSASQKTWPVAQDHYSYQSHASKQKISTDNHLNAPVLKQNSDSPEIRKTWPNSQDSDQVLNKSHGLISTHTQNQVLSTTKSQPSPATTTMTISQTSQSSMKRPLEFPANSIESVKAVAVKRRRYPAKKLGCIDPWRVMLALKSGLLAESTWALDTLAILLADNNSAAYFGLNHLPGLLNVLVDHYRCFLNKIFHLANDVEVKTLQKLGSYDDFSYLTFNEISDIENKVKVLNTPNYTFKTRCKKRVEIQYDEALFLIDPQRSWDKYEGFDVSLEHWQKGGGDITMHIQTTFDNCSKRIKFCRELYSEEKTRFKLNKVSIQMKSLEPVFSNQANVIKPSMLHKGEPVVVLQKYNFLASKLSTSGNESGDNLLVNSNITIKKPIENVKKEDFMDSCESASSDSNTNAGEFKSKKFKPGYSKDSSLDSDIVLSENLLQLRGSSASCKRFLSKDLEDECYSFDEPALCIMSDAQEMLSRRCVCVSTILRNLSFVPGNDVIMSKNSGILLLLGRLLLLHHEHKPVKKVYHKYAKEIDGNQSWNDSCISLKNNPEWWWGTLSVLRDNTLVILSNISGALDLAPFPEEVSLPILDGLLHWIVCSSSYAQDPLPSQSQSSVLSPQRLSLEALCKLSVLSSNVDFILATPPWSRIEKLFAFLTKLLCQGQDQIMREFALILLSNISQADSIAARTIAEQSCCISYLIAFIEEAEANAFQIAVSQGTKKLRDKPELMGTTPEMVKRAASTLKSLALVLENRSLFVRHQGRLLSLVMSQVMDQELGSVIADVLFYCSQCGTNDGCTEIPIT